MIIIILCREGDPVGSYGRAEAKNVWNAIKEWLEIKGSKIHTFPLSACNKMKDTPFARQARPCFGLSDPLDGGTAP